jgi:hypothetical protein
MVEGRRDTEDNPREINGTREGERCIIVVLSF